MQRAQDRGVVGQPSTEHIGWRCIGREMELRTRNKSTRDAEENAVDRRHAFVGWVPVSRKSPSDFDKAGKSSPKLGGTFLSMYGGGRGRSVDGE